jgi:hypothetical protein
LQSCRRQEIIINNGVNTAVIIIMLIVGLLPLIYIFSRMDLSRQFHRQVAQLFRESKIIGDKTFKQDQLSGLPEPVQRYFKHILKEGQPYISYARITHNGQFKTGADRKWSDIRGEQYATTQRPGFIWKGATSMFTARDLYISDQGRLVVMLFSIFRVVNAKGPHYDQGELLRWLGESVLYPTNLLPCERLHWVALDETKAKLVFDYNGLSLFFIVTFNEVGEIIQMETKRYMDEQNLETWVIKLADYADHNNVMVPTAFEVLWRLDDGDFSYAKFNLQKVEYDISMAF